MPSNEYEVPTASAGPLRREPPAAVRRTLRQEVGFGCPVPGCGSPYLTWHHFDPPWSERQHHEPTGMVALCRDHHAEADAGAFTMEQLRRFKERGRDRDAPVVGRMNWMRDEIVAVVGGNFFVNCKIAVRVRDMPVVWFGRDDEGNVLVNLRQLTTSGEPRMVMLDNFWITEGASEHDIECPPSGRLVRASYPNGDRLKIEFQSHRSWEEFERRFPAPPPPEPPEWLRASRGDLGLPEPVIPSQRERAIGMGLTVPMTTVSIEMNVEGAGIRLGPRGSDYGGVAITGSWMGGCQVGVQIGDAGEDGPGAH